MDSTPVRVPIRRAHRGQIRVLGRFGSAAVETQPARHHLLFAIMYATGRSLIERPRRRLLLILAAATIIIGTGVVLSEPGSDPPRNDQASLDRLRSQFAQRPWEPSLISAKWDPSGNLSVRLSSDDRQLAPAACSDLIDIVHWRTSVGPSTGPDGVIYTYTNDDGELSILDRSSNILVTNFLSLHTGCRWRFN